MYEDEKVLTYPYIYVVTYPYIYVCVCVCKHVNTYREKHDDGPGLLDLETEWSFYKFIKDRNQKQEIHIQRDRDKNSERHLPSSLVFRV